MMAMTFGWVVMFGTGKKINGKEERHDLYFRTKTEADHKAAELRAEGYKKVVISECIY